jgi:hypothetical protein
VERIRERSRRLAAEAAMPNRMERQLRETGRHFTGPNAFPEEKVRLDKDDGS